jgi:DNA modification methylase
MATECANQNHSAAFPVELPGWFIRLFTQPGDTVLDPFLGSGTTAVACIELDRNFIGIETNEEYVRLAQNRIKGVWKQPSLFQVHEARELYDLPSENSR